MDCGSFVPLPALGPCIANRMRERHSCYGISILATFALPALMYSAAGCPLVPFSWTLFPRTPSFVYFKTSQGPLKTLHFFVILFLWLIIYLLHGNNVPALCSDLIQLPLLMGRLAASPFIPFFPCLYRVILLLFSLSFEGY